MTSHMSVQRIMPSALVGVLAALTAVQLAEVGLRYLVFFALAAAVALVVAMVPDRRRFFLAAFVLCLQLDATMYFFYRGSSRSTGWSGPPGIELPLAFLPAAALFLIAANAARDAKVREWDWGGSVGLAGVALVGTAALSLVPSDAHFITVCSVMRATQLLVILLAMANAVRDRDDVNLILRLLPLLLVTQSVVYLVETALGATFTLTGNVIEQGEGIGRHGGTVGVTPAAFAGFLAPLVQIALAQFLIGGKRGMTWRAVAVGLGMFAMLMTYTRAAWVGMALGAVVVVLLGLRRGLIAPRRVVGFALLGLCALAVTFPTMALRLGNNAGDADERFALMEIAMRVIRAHPILGIGAGTYTFSFGNYLTGSEEGWLYVVHNAYLLRWAETGLPGIVALVVFLAYALRDGTRLGQSQDREIATLGIGWTAGLIALAWEMWWDIFNGFTYNALFWALCGFVIAIRRIESHSHIHGLQKAENAEAVGAIRVYNAVGT